MMKESSPSPYGSSKVWIGLISDLMLRVLLKRGSGSDSLPNTHLMGVLSFIVKFLDGLMMIRFVWVFKQRNNAETILNI